MDASIGMMLHSFITAQKFSVRRQLKRSFAKFLSTGEDRAHLLLHILQDMMKKEKDYQIIRHRQRGNGADELDMLEVPLSDFVSKAREKRVFDVTEFCRGEAFVEAGYSLDTNRQVISRAASGM
jgi:DNA replication licensing factor MCM2